MKLNQKILFTLLSFVLLAVLIQCKKLETPKEMAAHLNTIVLTNSSFEGIPPACCTVPTGWANLAMNIYTPPDIQPGIWEVNLEPYDGQTYMGMVVRDDGTEEGLYYELKAPLKKGQKYRFSAFLAQSDSLFSASATTGLYVNYIEPTKFYIGGFPQIGNPVEIFDETAAITTFMEWKKYDFTIEPSQDCNYFVIGAAHVNSDSTNGHVLVDACSTIDKF